MNNIRVAIFEDNDQLREMLSQMIAISEGMECVGAYANAMDLEIKLSECLPQVVLMDIDMPGMDGINAVGIIKEKFPEVLILMQTVFEDSEKVFDSICAGATGYLLKNYLSEHLVPSIRNLTTGGAPMTPSIAKKILNRFREQNPFIVKTEYDLSDREKEVLTYLMKGMSYKLIAANCFLSIDTVKFHVKNIYQKLHVNSKSEAILKAMKSKII